MGKESERILALCLRPGAADNAAAADISLSPDELARIDGIFAPQAIAGKRGSAAYLERVNR